MRPRSLAATTLFGALLFAAGGPCRASQPPADPAPLPSLESPYPGFSPFRDPARGSGYNPVLNLMMVGYRPLAEFGQSTGGTPGVNLRLAAPPVFIDSGHLIRHNRFKDGRENFRPYRDLTKDSTAEADESAEAEQEPEAEPADDNSPPDAGSDEEDDKKRDAPIPWADAKKVGREGAAENFSNVVETYLAKHGAHGLWSYDSGSKTLVLQFVGVDTDHVKKAGEYFVACADFLETGAKRRVRLEFTADFTDAPWKIVSVRPRARGGPCVD